MAEENINNAVAKELGLPVEVNNFVADRQLLIDRVNELIIKDFEKLVSILYRIDVSEAKINTLLKEFPATDAAETIVNLMLEREAEKVKTREQFKRRDDDFNEEEKW
jgi:hypothetical protein